MSFTDFESRRRNGKHQDEERRVNRNPSEYKPKRKYTDSTDDGRRMLTSSESDGSSEDERVSKKRGLDRSDPKTSSSNEYTRSQPSFQKPKNNDLDVGIRATHHANVHRKHANEPRWKKKETEQQPVTSHSIESNPSDVAPPVNKVSKINTHEILTDQQMNELGAKILKAEIMGNNNVADELREKLELLRKNRTEHKKETAKSRSTERVDHSTEILLTSRNNRGDCRPARVQSKSNNTNKSNERLRHILDDDKHDIRQMFEKEKFGDTRADDKEFVTAQSKQKIFDDDYDDGSVNLKTKTANSHDEHERAIRDHEKLMRTLDSCEHCLDSRKLNKQLIVSTGTSAYLSLPWHGGLQTGQCIIAPLAHVGSVTQLDEDVWSEIRQFMKAIVRMFADRKMDVIFFESAIRLHKGPHLQIHCVPGKFEMAPFYFKKAIEEAEGEWTTNKKLISVERGDVKRVVPKGLPYFWVNFGVDKGFAHVIEDRDNFSDRFAEEIIGGMLHLDAARWRKPRKVNNLLLKIEQFVKWWTPYDFTK